VHHEFIPEGAMVKKERYIEVLVYLQEVVHLKHPEIWAKTGYFHTLVTTSASPTSPSMVLWCFPTQCILLVPYHAIFIHFYG
jgi:hypothetical protein